MIDIINDKIYLEGLALHRAMSTEELLNKAELLRNKFRYDHFEMCSIFNIKSGKCSEDCKWCAQSGHYKTHVESYEMKGFSDVYEYAAEMERQDVARFSLVTSGRKASDDDVKQLSGTFKQLGENFNLSLCGSFGLLSRNQLDELKSSGMKRYHCNIETAPSFFSKLCSSHSMDEKLETISYAKELGLEVCSGGIIGMGETMEQRIEMAALLCALEIKSIPVNVLDPIEGTPLGNSPALSDDELLRSFAMFRILNPDAQIRFAGGRRIIGHLQEVLMTKIVDAALVGDLLTTVGSGVDEDKDMISRLNLKIRKDG